MPELDGFVALVTGAGRNIGRAIALDLARAGAAVVVNARSNQVEADAVVKEIADAGGKAVAVLGDVADPDAAMRMVGMATSRFGRLDILVNNAAVRGEVPFAELDFARWRAAHAVCLDGAFHCTKAAHMALKASGQGAIVNIGGVSAHLGASERVHVLAAKLGLVGFTRGLAHDLAPDGITANCVVPGQIDTARAAGKQPSHHATHKPLVGRRGRPEEIASTVRWLAGPNGRYITGQTIHVNGGLYHGS
ncbi:MAG: SDR family oxidoreductase [Alphaproteobacteria bacterium]|nr:SDR family oxidoreductase [Alphaproteobacteria bacterium]